MALQALINNSPDMILLPGKGIVVRYDILNASTVRLAFDTDKVLFDRSENNLVISSSDGTIVLADFFVQEEKDGLPNFELVDGSTVAAADFLHAHNTSMDISTAAEAEKSITQSSAGLNEYETAAQDLITGVARLSAANNQQVETNDRLTPGNTFVVGTFASSGKQVGSPMEPQPPITPTPIEPADPVIPPTPIDPSDPVAPEQPEALDRDHDEIIVISNKPIDGLVIHGDSVAEERPISLGWQ